MTNQISNFSFSVSPEASASTHDDGIVILHTGKGRVFSSNKTGALIWRGIEQQRSLDGIAEEISGEFQIAGTTARAHTLNFLAALEQQSLIQREVAS
ncbi:MAG TPA: PqqD family protein [Pyrinomonadaceae bacterium]|nr:PqqD family protein [Pyrinomonadaceae bacterium]